jgi:outer membrane protein TolC
MELNCKRILFMVLLAIPTLIFPQSVMQLTLEKSVDLALEKNPEIKMAEKNLAKSKAGIWEAYSTLFPQVNGSVNYQKSWDIQSNTMPNFFKGMMRPEPGVLPPDLESIFNAYSDAMPDFVAFPFGLENTLIYGATLTQPLFLGGAGLAGVKISYAAHRAARENLEMKRQGLIFQSANAFYACLLTKEITAVQEEALSQAQANLDVVAKKYTVGAASGFDKMRAEVEVANLKPSVINARNGYNSAISYLRNVLGLEKEVQIEVVGDLNYIDDKFSETSLAEIQQMTLENRPEIHLVDEQKYIANKSLCIARSNFMPKVFFQTDYSMIANRNDNKFTQDDFSKGYTSAISLQIPLFTSFRNSAQYQKARMDFKIMQDTEKQVSDGLTTEAEVVYHSFQEAKQKYQAAAQSVDLAKEALRLANMMYEEGANTQLDVLSSQLALTRAKLNYVSSLYEYQMARYQLRKVTGTLKKIL